MRTWPTDNVPAEPSSPAGPAGRERLAVTLPVRPPQALHAPHALHAPLPERHINTAHLRRFVILMHHETAVAAQRHTGVRAACIHYAIRRLEDRLGTALFEREGSSMRPTAAARRLYPCAIRLLAMWDSLVDQSTAPA